MDVLEMRHNISCQLGLTTSVVSHLETLVFFRTI